MSNWNRCNMCRVLLPNDSDEMCWDCTVGCEETPWDGSEFGNWCNDHHKPHYRDCPDSPEHLRTRTPLTGLTEKQHEERAHLEERAAPKLPKQARKEAVNLKLRFNRRKLFSRISSNGFIIQGLQSRSSHRVVQPGHTA